MSEGYSLEGIKGIESADADILEAYADTKLGFESTPREVVIDSAEAVEAFKREHGVDLTAYLEGNQN